MITANEKEIIEKGRSSCSFDSTWEGDFDGMKEVEEMKKKKKKKGTNQKKVQTRFTNNLVGKKLFFKLNSSNSFS